MSISSIAAAGSMPRTLPWRMMCSVTVERSLRGVPLRRIKAAFKWVVVMVNMSPSILPVEKPCQVCAAYSGGCGRPSIQMVRSGACQEMCVWYAMRRCDSLSTSFQILKFAGPRGE